MSQSQYDNPILQLIFHSGSDLAKLPFSWKASSPYVMAAIISPDNQPIWKKTCTDEKGGEKPLWDYEIRFPLNQQQLDMPRNFNLVCRIMHRGKTLGDREIGHVKARLSLLLSGAASGENIIYPVVSNGEERGRIVISHKLLTNAAVIGAAAAPPQGVENPNQNPKFFNTASVPHPLSLELTFHCGIDLPHPLFNSKAKPYVVAAVVACHTKPNWAKTNTAVVAFHTKPNWAKTNTDEHGGENPVWGHRIHFPMTQENITMARNFNIICKVMHSGHKLGDREIGRVKVPLKTFLDGAGENIPYPVLVSGGTVEKGTIVMSHRLVTNTAGDVSSPQDSVPNTGERIKIFAGVTTIATCIYKVVKDAVQ